MLGSDKIGKDISVSNDFTVRSTSFSYSGVLDIFTYLKQQDKEIIFSTEEFNVYFLGLSDFIISFSNEGDRSKYKESLVTLDIPNNSNQQQPKLRGSFEYEGRYYLILGAKYNFDDGVSDKHSYKGIIFDVENFTPIEDSNSRINDILEEK